MRHWHLLILIFLVISTRWKALVTALSKQYRNHPTQKHSIRLTVPIKKKLIFCTKGGSISYVSKTYSGSASDRFITEDCNVVRKFTPGFIAMFDKRLHSPRSISV